MGLEVFLFQGQNSILQQTLSDLEAVDLFNFLAHEASADVGLNPDDLFDVGGRGLEEVGLLGAVGSVVAAESHL